MALNIENIIAEIKEASILELNDLVKKVLLQLKLKNLKLNLKKLELQLLLNNKVTTQVA